MTNDPEGRQRSPARRERPHGSLVFQSLSEIADQKGLEWVMFHPGVEIHWLYREGNNGSSAALIRYQPGASIPLHEHQGFEHIYVLKGSQTDGDGALKEGGLMVHPPGTRHRIASADGCLVLAIYEKPAKFGIEDGKSIS